MTIRELGIKLGFEVDKSSEKKAENNINKLKDFANKALSMIGIGISLKGIIGAIKKIEAVKKATDDAKKKWSKALQEFDKAIGFTKIIVGWIHKISTLGLSLFRRIQPKIQKFIKSLGGIENVLRLIAIAFVALNFTKIISFLKTAIQLLNLGSAKMLAIVAIFLIIEDFIYFILGKNSLIGEMLKKNGVDVDKLRERIRLALAGIKKFFTETWTDIGKVMKKVFGKIGEVSQKAFRGIKKLWDEHGQKIAKNLKKSWNILSDTFGKLREKIKPITDKVSELVGKLRDGNDSIDIWNSIGTALEKISEFLVSVTDGIEKAVDAIPDLDEIQQGLSKIKNYIKEHETGITLLAIAMGTLTSAIVAYNVAQAIKNAGGIVEIAQLAATAVGVGVLTVAETAHSVASSIAAAATSAFGAALSFLTSPITLIILAIGALIAIVVLLVKNWDKVKEVAQKVWKKITDSVKKAKESISQHFSELKQKVVNKFQEIKDGIVQKVQTVIAWFKSNWKQLLLLILNPFAGAFALIYNNSEKFRNFVNGLLDKIKDLFNTFKESVVNKFLEIKDGILSKWEEIEKWFLSLKDKAVTWAKDMIDGFIAGITAKWEALKNKFSSIANLAKSLLGHSTPDEGPMKDDDKWMPDFMDNLSGGIRKGIPKIQGAIRKVSGTMSVLKAASKPMPETASVTKNTSNHRTINQYNNFTNTFNGSDRVAQGRASEVMNNNANDATAALARAIAYQR